MKLRYELVFFLIPIILYCKKEASFSDIEIELMNTKRSMEIIKLYTKIGLVKTFQDSVKKEMTTERGSNIFSDKSFIKSVNSFLIKGSQKRPFQILKIRLQEKDFPDNLDDLLDIITIRNSKGRTVFTRAYIFKYCTFVEDEGVEIKKIDDSRYILEAGGAGSCGLTFSVEFYYDTLILSKDNIEFRPHQGEPEKEIFNRMDLAE